jgi:collagen type VII alpha
MAYYPYGGPSSQNTGYLGTPYTQAQVDAVPFLGAALSQIPQYNYSNQAASLINSAMANPVAYVQSQLPLYTENAALGGQVSADDITQATSYLANNGVSTQDIQQQVNQGIQQAQTAQSGSGTFFGIGGTIGAILSNPEAIGSLVAAAVIPGLAESMAPAIADALGVSTTTATAVAGGTLHAAAQIAAGTPVNEALQNAAIYTVVQTGSNAAASAMVNSGSNPVLANVITSGAASAVQTIAEGGTTSQALQNASAASAGAGTVAGASALGAGTTTSNVLGGAVTGASEAGGNTLTTLQGAAGGAGKSLTQTTPSTPSTPSSGQTSSVVPPILQNATASLDTGTNTDAGSSLNVSVIGIPYQTGYPPPSNVALPQGYSLANADTPNAVSINTSNGNTAWVVQTDPNASPIPPASLRIQPNVPPVGTGINLSTLDQGTAEGLLAILNPGGGSGGQSEASIAFVGSVNGTPIYSANGIQFSLITVNGSPALQDANGTVYPIPDNSSLLPTLSQTQIYQNALANAYNDTVPNINTSVASTETPVTPTPTQPTPAQSTDTQPVGNAGKGGGGGGGGTSGAEGGGGGGGATGTTGGSAGGAISQVGQAGVASTSGGQTGAAPSTPAPADINLPVSQGQTGITGTTGVGGVTGTTGVGGVSGTTGAPATPGSVGDTNVPSVSGFPSYQDLIAEVNAARAFNLQPNLNQGTPSPSVAPGPPSPSVAPGPVSPGPGGSESIGNSGGPGSIGGSGPGGIGGAGGGTGGGVGTGGGTGEGEGEGGGEGGGVGGGEGSGVGSGIGGGSGAGTGLNTPYIPNLFIASNVPKNAKLASALNIAPIFLTGQTQGLGGGGGGGVSVESNAPQKAVWNVSSLKLQPGAEEPEDKDKFSSLSNALGI